MALCQSVSVTSRCFIETTGRISVKHKTESTQRTTTESDKCCQAMATNNMDTKFGEVWTGVFEICERTNRETFSHRDALNGVIAVPDAPCTSGQTNYILLPINWSRNFVQLLYCLFSARRYASAGTSYGPVSVSVCHKSVFCYCQKLSRERWTLRAW